jgi:macrolide-specific efflux system membrane fusion protein
VTAANAQLTVAQQNLPRATLTAPFSGTVASVALTVGQQVSGNSSAGTNPTPAGVSGASGTSGGSGAASSATATSSTPNADVVVISTGTYVVDASVDDTEVGQLRSGEQAIIVPEGATRQVDGTVASVGMVGNQSSGVTTYPVTITVTGSPGDLPLGASAQISIIVRQLTGAVVVPRTAVHQNGAGSVVYEMAGGTQVSHPVTVGLSAGGQTQIISGLAAGTPVVVPAAPTGSSPSTTRRGNGAAGTGRGGGFSGGGFSGGGRVGRTG